ncbi:recombinase family protein [Microbacterium sp. NPDC079995]|uniref:recombinase family protein n=1 Tax=unclassified Microbacterium TaxID=2609290 RepID=UPI0034506B5F
MGRTITTPGHPVVPSSRHAVIYTRISNDREGKKLGVERQETACREVAAQLGLTVVGVYSDNDVSASRSSKKPRPSYEAMITAAGRREFGTIIAYSMSRLTRRPREWEDLIDLAEQIGTRYAYKVSPSYDLTTADGQGVARTVAAWDAAEAKRISERVKEAVDQRKEDGSYHGAAAPFGFSLKESVPVIDDREAEMIREAATRLLDANDSLYQIVRDWNGAGRFTRGGNRWRHSVLRTALTNPALIGETRPIIPTEGKVAPSRGVKGWDAILDEPTFFALRDKLEPDSSRRTNPLGVKSSKYAMAGGLTVCGRCGKALTAVKRDGQPAKLVCRAMQNGDHENHPKRPDGTSEGRVSVDHGTLEAHVFDRFIARLNDNDYWNEHKRDIDPMAADKIAEAERRREGELAKIRRAEDQAFDGLIDTDRLRELIDRTRQAIRGIEDEIAELRGTPSARDTIEAAQGGAEAILAGWPAMSPSDRRTLLKFLVDRVVIGDWPDGIPSNATNADLRREAMAKRAEIVWRKA